MMCFKGVIVCFYAFLFIVECVTSSGLRVRKSVSGIAVQELSVTSNVANRYANVLVRSLVINKGSDDQEVKFLVRLPIEAFITRFEMESKNRTIVAVIKSKEEAEKIYNQARQDNVTAGHVSQVTDTPRDVDIDVFQIAVNVASNSTVEFRLHYEERLQRHAEKFVQKLYMDSDHPVSKVSVNCHFKEKQQFKTLTYYAQGKAITSDDRGILTTEGFYEKAIQWSPSVSEKSSVKFSSMFEIEYELDIPANGGLVLYNEMGEFAYIFSVPCEDDKIMGKEIVFVIDISGSMNGNPITQVRKAMDTILSQIRSKDRFNIIIFDDASVKWRIEFQAGNLDNILAAKQFVQQNVVASGSTNINDALLLALQLFGSEPEERLGQIVVFLTDGSPTAGETNVDKIREHVRERNYIGGERCCKSAIYTIAFGRHASIDFLRKIAYENAGTLTIIKEIQSDVADSELRDVYNDLANPIYKNLVFTFEVDNEIVPTTNLTESSFLQYDCGNELIIGGWSQPDTDVVPVMTADGAYDDVVFNTVPTIKLVNRDSEMLSRLIVYQRVKQLLEVADISLDPEIKQEAEQTALKLSLEYGFVTPLTSMVVADYGDTKIDVGGLDERESFSVYASKASTGSVVILSSSLYILLVMRFTAYLTCF